MSLSDPLKARSGLFVIFSIGVGLLALHASHALGEGEDLRTFLLGIGIPMGFAVAVLVGGVWLWRREVGADFVLRVGVWCAVGAVVLAVGAVLIVLYEQAEGVNMSDKLFVVVNAASVGSAVGFVVGLYDGRQRVARREATRLSHQLTVLNRVLRHDIRNDANVIQGNAELLTDTETDTAEHARKIQQQAADLVDLGDYAREIEKILHDGGRKREVVDIGSLAAQCAERIARDYPNADIDASLPETRTVYAHSLVLSALTNVIENAVEHNDKRTPRVEITSTTVFENGTEYVELRVADNGPGIPESEVEVLERGYETELEHTSGLGLWLVNWIVVRSDGSIRFEENEPVGSVVQLRFERAQATSSRGDAPDLLS